MPVADRKTGKKSKNGGRKAPPPLPPINVTVRDCMVWPEPKAKEVKGVTFQEKPSVYRSTLIKRDTTSEGGNDYNAQQTTIMTSQPRHQVRRDDGTAIEALRGWPGSNTYEDDSQNGIDYDLYLSQASLQNPAPQEPGKNSKGKKGKKGVSKEAEEHIYIGDLIHQRYRNEYLDKRRKELEKEQRKKEESATAAKAGRRAALDRCNIKSNRSSQLRSIALAEKVEKNPMELWKMPRFTKDAQPHLSTTAGGPALHRRGAGKAGGGLVDSEGCDGGGGGCLCDYSYRANNLVDDNDDVEINYPGVEGCDDAICDSP